ncbi:MAG: hypothetical protein IPM91_08210 [Bacteroidetes bacterium]|nr:hypothetical protein [Bacteroidota bacterium]
MNTLKFIGSVAVLLAGTMFYSCSSSSEKVDQAQEEVKEANQELDQAKEDYAAELETYRKETADRISANEVRIAELKAKADAKNEKLDKDYQKKWLTWKIETAN